MSITFAYNGGAGGSDNDMVPQDYVVPAGVTSLDIECFGARGSSALGTTNLPGLGGQIRAVIPVTPGETLKVYTGGWPHTAGGGYRQSPGDNGGGPGGFFSAPGGGGGGATDVRRSPYGLADRLIVAGGGGGAGVWSPGGPGGSGHGGHGGYPEGGSGSYVYGAAFAGGGGTQTTGGAAGVGFSFGYTNLNTAGSLGQGGSGMHGFSMGGTGGGGGGGGYYGGGGAISNSSADCAGGGGGSSAVLASGATILSHQTGTWADSGQAIILLIPSPPVVNAGLDQEMKIDDLVQLDGSASTWSALSVTTTWAQLSGPSVTLSSTTSLTPTFTAPHTEGTLVFELSIVDDYVEVTDTVTIEIVNTISYVKKAGLGQLSLFSGSDLDGGVTTGPVLTSRFLDLTDIATGRDGSQRPVLMNKNVFYVADGTQIKMLHSCDLDVPAPPEAALGYWLGYADGTQTISGLETPGENIFFTESIVNTTDGSMLYDLQRYYPDFLNYGTFIVSDFDGSLSYDIEIHIEFVGDGDIIDMGFIVTDGDTNTFEGGIGGPGPGHFEWTGSFTTDPGTNMLLTVEPDFLADVGSITVGAGSYMKVSQA